MVAKSADELLRLASEASDPVVRAAFTRAAMLQAHVEHLESVLGHLRSFRESLAALSPVRKGRCDHG